MDIVELLRKYDLLPSQCILAVAVIDGVKVPGMLVLPRSKTEGYVFFKIIPYYDHDNFGVCAEVVEPPYSYIQIEKLIGFGDVCHDTVMSILKANDPEGYKEILCSNKPF